MFDLIGVVIYWWICNIFHTTA